VPYYFISPRCNPQHCLSRTIKSTKDEEGKEVREYTDKNGRVILKKVQAVSSPTLSNKDHWAQTYYVYDDFGNLRFVVPPVLSQTIHQNDTYNPSSSDMMNWAFDLSRTYNKSTKSTELSDTLAMKMATILFKNIGLTKINSIRGAEIARPAIGLADSRGLPEFVDAIKEGSRFQKECLDCHSRNCKMRIIFEQSRSIGNKE
jgi:hypothetical protein